VAYKATSRGCDIVLRLQYVFGDEYQKLGEKDAVLKFPVSRALKRDGQSLCGGRVSEKLDSRHRSVPAMKPLQYASDEAVQVPGQEVWLYSHVLVSRGLLWGSEVAGVRGTR
jgi:hypothetical protein